MGATFSYCNSGYSILGRLVEVLRGTSWDQALRDQLLDPIGADETATLPEDLIGPGSPRDIKRATTVSSTPSRPGRTSARSDRRAAW